MGNINRHQNGNEPSLEEILTVKCKDIVSIPRAVDCRIEDNIVLADGVEFNRFYHTEQSGKFFEEEEETSHGILYKNQTSSFVPKDRSEVLTQLKVYEKERHVLLVKTKNNTFILVGSKENGVLLKRNRGTGALGGDKNGYECVFSGVDSHECYIYSGEYSVDSSFYSIDDEPAEYHGAPGMVTTAEFDAEVLRATDAEADLQDAIDAEVTRATDRENELQVDINNAVTAMNIADNALQTDLDNHKASGNADHHLSLEDVRSEDNFVSGEVDMNNYALRNVPVPTLPDHATNKAYVDGKIDATLKAPEAYTPSGGLYPTTYGGNPIKKGDTFRFGAGTMGAVTTEGEELGIAQIDNPGQTDANWEVLESNREQATEATKGIAKIASQAEIENEITSNNTDIVTPQKFWFGVLRFLTQPWTWTLKQTFTTAPRFPSTTINQYLKSDGSKDLVSVSTADVKTDLNLTGTNSGDETTVTIGTLINGATNKPAPVDADLFGISDSADSTHLKKLSWAALATAILTRFQDATGGLVGLTLFKINFKNAANSFTSFLTNANTAVRTYTFQDRNGTIADDTDLALQAKVANQEVIHRPLFGNISNNTSITTGQMQATYIKKAQKAYTQVQIAFRVGVAGTATTWAELAIFKGTPSFNGNASLTRIGSVSILTEIATTGVKQKTISGLSIAAGDELWFVFGNAGTIVGQIRGHTADGNQSGCVQFATQQPSTAATPLATTLEGNGVVGPDCVCFFS